MPPNTSHDLLTTHSLNVMFSRVNEGNVDVSMLNTEQLKAVKLAQELDSFFPTGDPGTEKTFTLSKIIEVLQSQIKQCQIGITASTGAAENRLQGSNNPFLGWSDWLRDECRTRSTKVSMITLLFFAQLDYIARKLRKCELPFGGICLITSGDFLQLPPVSVGRNLIEFAFQSSAWDPAFKDNHIRLQLSEIAAKPRTIHLIRDIKMDDNGIPIHVQPGPVHTVGCREQALFPLVKFQKHSKHEHVLILDEEFVFQAVKDRKEFTTTRFQI
ncbi:hypothetical protein BDR07DRAFT_1378932 [Suillus spraguei]|nr:hypothetical protein BDR07DRAFT_1378932 [Suillus spraguei]